MNKREIAKTFSWGVILGSIALTIVAFSANWIVTRGTQDQNVRTAWIDGQAGICVTLVRNHRKATNDTTELTGWSGREAREKFAKDFAVIPAGTQGVDQSVIYACSSLLDKRT